MYVVYILYITVLYIEIDILDSWVGFAYIVCTDITVRSPIYRVAVGEGQEPKTSEVHVSAPKALARLCLLPSFTGFFFCLQGTET